MIIRFIQDLYLSSRFFYLFGGIMLLMTLSFVLPFLLPIAQLLLVLGGVMVAVDLMLLYNRSAKLEGVRVVPKLLSLGDPNQIQLKINNTSGLKLSLLVVDELPYQLQVRDFRFLIDLEPGEHRKLGYKIRPTRRGEYQFNNLNVYAASSIRLIRRRHKFRLKEKVPVYPSIIQMKQYELFAFSSISRFQGVKKIRRLGHNYEFEQIKNYVRGDDYRSINWKATGRRGELMVNQYQDEKAQQIYCLIDKSRSMTMPFHELSLMDYAINTSLMISNVALKKHDKAGLLTFSEKLGTVVKADYKLTQLNRILQALYNQKEKNLEANFELLYLAVRNMIKGRSLLLLFTNFESIYAAERALPVLRRLNRLHLLVTIFFENSEIQQFASQDVGTIEDIYLKTIAQKYNAEKKQIVQSFNQYGIQTILTQPEDLSINTLNKYLELKSRGLI